MASEETLKIFPELEDITQDLSNEQFGILVRAAMAYRFRGVKQSIDDPVIRFGYRYMTNQIDRVKRATLTKSKAAQSRWNKQADTDECTTMQNDSDECTTMQSDAPIQSIPIQSIPKESKADEPPAPTKRARKSYGEFGWVKLSDDEYNRLLNDLGEAEVKRCIAYVDESAQLNKNKNKWRDWNLVLRKCSRDGWGLRGNNITRRGPRELDEDELAAIARLTEGNT